MKQHRNRRHDHDGVAAVMVAATVRVLRRLALCYTARSTRKEFRKGPWDMVDFDFG